MLRTLLGRAPAAWAVAVAGFCLVVAAGSASGSATPGWRVTETDPNMPLEGVAAVSASEAWVSGFSFTSGLPAVKQWDGTVWKPLPGPPVPVQDTYLGGNSVIGASGPANVWFFPMISNLVSASTLYGLQWNGRSWAKFTFPANTSSLACAVFSSGDVWMFGEKFKSSTLTVPYVARYNGRSWSQVPAPGTIAGVSTISASDFWAYGQAPGTSGSQRRNMAMHWTGQRWLSFTIPQPAPVTGQTWYPTGIAAVSDTNVWVSEGLTGPKPAIVLFHWDGVRWSLAFRKNTEISNGLAPDGHGGLWLATAVSFPNTKYFLVHYTNGRWIPQPPPSASFPSNPALIPGTQSLWGLAALNSSSGPTWGILKYGP